MPVSYNSAARNLFLLGSSGQQVAQNFFKYIDKDDGSGDGYIDTEQIRYIEYDDKYVIAGSGRNLNLVSYGFFDKRDYDQETDPENPTTTLDYEKRIVSTGNNPAINFAFLENLHVDSNGDLIACGNVDGTTPWIAKYSYSTGNVIWQSTTNQGSINYRSVTSDSTGYYACGHSVLTGEAVVEKYDLNGNPLWGKKVSTVGGSQNKIQLFGIASNSRGQLVAVGDIVDIDQTKGYMIKFTTSGDFLWDKSLQADIETSSFDHQTRLEGIHIDDKDQIYVSGHIQSTQNFFRDADRTGWVGKYTGEGNLIWQRESNNGAGTHMSHRRISADDQTEQVIVLSAWSSTTDDGAALSKYSKNGTLLWRRSLISDSSSFVESPVLDADSSFYYLAFTDEDRISVSNTPEGYVFGKVSTSGNGLGAFQYPDGSGINQGYEILNVTDKIGRLDDGSVRFDSSDLRKTPFSANHIVFDDYATQVTKKKVNIKDAGVIQYSGSPAIRPADFETRELTTDGYGVPPQKNYIGLSESLQPSSTSTSPTPNNTWTRQSTNVNVAANNISNPLGVGSGAERYGVSATSGRRLEYGVPSGVFVAGQTYTYSWWMKAITTDAQWAFQALYAGSSNNSIRIADRYGNILENISTTNTTTYKPTDTEWHRVVWTFTANNTGSGAIGGYNENSETGDLWYLWGAQLVDGPDPLPYYRNYNGSPENAAGTEHAPSIVNGAYEFDGSEILQIGPVPEIEDEFTVEIWFKSDTHSNWQNPIDCNYSSQDLLGNGVANSGNIGPRFEINAAGNFFWAFGATLAANDPYFATPAGSGSTGVWYHSVLTYGGGGATDGRSYLDGEFVQQSFQSFAGTAGWVGEFRNVILGRGFALATRYFDGQIGEVRIYPKALTAAQVSQNYNATKSKYIAEAPDTAPKISNDDIVYDSYLLLNYDFGNRATYDTAQNLIRNSTDATSFTGYQRTITNNAALAPDGTMTAAKIAYNDTSGGADAVYYLDEVTNIPANNAGTYTYSVWLRGPDGFTGGARIALLIQTGSNTEISVDLTDEWQQYTVTKTYDGTFSTNIRIHPVIFRNKPGSIDNGRLVPEFVYLWHPQLEKSSTTGRHVPTYGSMIQPTKVKNLSSNSYTGTINGATFNSDGYFETTANAYVSAGAGAGSTGTSAMTIEQWVRASSLPVTYHATFYSQSSNVAGFYGVGYGTPDHWFFSDYDGVGRNIANGGSSAPTLNVWYHFCGRRDANGNLTIWINGSDVTTGMPISTGLNFTAADPRIGNNPAAANGEYWDGDIAETRIYNRALTATEISQNFNATRGKYGV